MYINVRENRRGNQEWTIQRHWQHWVCKAQDEDKEKQKVQHRKLKKNEQLGPHQKYISCTCIFFFLSFFLGGGGGGVESDTCFIFVAREQWTFMGI